MSEWRLTEGPFPFTPEWYAGRERAPHLEQPVHGDRLRQTSDVVHAAVEAFGIMTVVDLGCGDGGLLSLLDDLPGGVRSWGYDLQATNVTAAIGERGVDAHLRDFLQPEIEWGELAVITEVLEHLEDPHRMVARIAMNATWVVASSPAFENPECHDPCHAWAWDQDGYRALFESAGFFVAEHRVLDGGFQLIFGEQF